MTQKLNLTTILILGLLPFLSAQESIIINDWSDLHIQIPGLDEGLIPPVGFQLNTQLNGFQNPEDPFSMIMVVEMPAPFTSVTSGFNSTTLAERNMNLISVDSCLVGKRSSILVKLDQPASGYVFSKYILIYGDENQTTMINGVYLQDSIKLGEEILTSIKTIAFSDDVIDARSSLPYTLTESSGNLVEATVMGNSLLLNRDGLLPTAHRDSFNVIVDYAFANVEINNLEEFSKNRVLQYSQGLEIDTDFPGEVSQLSGWPSYGLFLKNPNNKEEVVYQLIASKKDGGYLIVLASWQNDCVLCLDDLVAMLSTLEPKE